MNIMLPGKKIARSGAKCCRFEDTLKSCRCVLCRDAEQERCVSVHYGNLTLIKMGKNKKSLRILKCRELKMV
jgi:hypothetical protein